MHQNRYNGFISEYEKIIEKTYDTGKPKMAGGSQVVGQDPVPLNLKNLDNSPTLLQDKAEDSVKKPNATAKEAHAPGETATLRPPTYPKSELSPGMVHIGFGNFHRAHQLYMTHHRLEDCYDAGKKCWKEGTVGKIAGMLRRSAGRKGLLVGRSAGRRGLLVG